jgi:transcriptional regulator GlxA family with amidase domain
MDWRVQHVVILMQHSLHRKTSLEELARYVNLSVSRLHHLFRLEMGTSLASYLRCLRMQKCQELLEATTLSVKEIINNVGINDRSHFDRDFKKAFGLTPIQYRAAAKLVVSTRNSVEEYKGIAEMANK